MAAPTTAHKLGAEALGTFWLVLGGCGSSRAGRRFARTGIGIARRRARLRPHGADRRVRARPHLGRPLQPRCHGRPRHRPGGSTGSDARRLLRRPRSSAPSVAGGGAARDRVRAPTASTAVASGFATNGYGDQLPGRLQPAGRHHHRDRADGVLPARHLRRHRHGAPAVGFAGIAIGLALTLIHLISIPVSNTSVNPARSLGVAWFGGVDALQQVWVFILAPVIGAAVAGVTHAMIVGEDTD